MAGDVAGVSFLTDRGEGAPGREEVVRLHWSGPPTFVRPRSGV